MAEPIRKQEWSAARSAEPWAQEQFRAHRIELNRKLRAAFLAGAEERSRELRGRGLTEAELLLTLGGYPGDLNG